MKSMSLAVVLAVCLLCVSAPTTAKEHPNLDANAIRAQQAQIRADAQARVGRYRDMSENDRARLSTLQQRVDVLTADIVSTTELREVDQIALFNALESIEALINRAEDERMICNRIKPVGSNRPKTVCKTVAQLREEREAAERDLARNQACTKGPGGMCL